MKLNWSSCFSAVINKRLSQNKNYMPPKTTFQNHAMGCGKIYWKFCYVAVSLSTAFKTPVSALDLRVYGKTDTF